MAPGESLGLLGVNGAGKTTAMNLLLGLTTPTSGTVRVFGLDLWKHRIEILKHLFIGVARSEVAAVGLL